MMIGNEFGSFNLTCVILSLAVCSCFFIRKQMVTKTLGTMGVLSAWGQSMLSVYALIITMLFYGSAYLYNSCNKTVFIKKYMLLPIIYFFAIIMILHLVPGISNIMAIDRVSLSPHSTAFTMYLNIDKLLLGLILFINTDLYDQEAVPRACDIKTTYIYLLVGIVAVSTIGLLAGILKIDPKIPSFFLLWCVNNMIFVCFSEEVLFRGMIQNQLSSLFKNPRWALIVASGIFGAAHFRGGLIYVVMATFAGICYGRVYQKTQRLSCAMLIHFSLNLIHILFFTYPMAIS